MFERSSGLLLHLTSLPGGRLGPAADDFLRFLEAAGQRWWQVLPVGPAGYAGSPYAAHSAMAGDESLLPLAPAALPEDRFREFRRRQRAWLPDYALYRALKERYGQRAWWTWPRGYRARDPAALAKARTELAPRIRAHEVAQCRFCDEWAAFRRRARDAGVGLIGDVPLFVARDSADVWARRSLFRLDVAAGVPPDYFSADGQLWGNPHYAWDAHRRSRFAWWIARFRQEFERFDALRIDHFLGLYRVWEVGRRARTAKNGRWSLVPGEALLRAVRKALGPRPLIAENLGIVTPEAESLRAGMGIPGMHVLHFAFGPDAQARPFWMAKDAVVYTGTHDNDTTRGWQAASPGDAARAQRYLDCDAASLPRSLLRLAWTSAADLAIAPAQDLLGLGTKARMNVPGTKDGNWHWRLKRGQLTPDHARHLRALTLEAARA